MNIQKSAKTEFHVFWVLSTGVGIGLFVGILLGILLSFVWIKPSFPRNQNPLEKQKEFILSVLEEKGQFHKEEKENFEKSDEAVTSEAKKPLAKSATNLPERNVPKENELLDPFQKETENLKNSFQRKPVTPKGSLDKEDIRDAIKSVLPDVTSCYEEGLKISPELGGKIVATFTIIAKDGQGKLDEASIEESALENPFVEACILGKLAQAEFPIPEGDGVVTVTYPFIFEKGE